MVSSRHQFKWESIQKHARELIGCDQCAINWCECPLFFPLGWNNVLIILSLWGVGKRLPSRRSLWAYSCQPVPKRKRKKTDVFINEAVFVRQHAKKQNSRCAWKVTCHSSETCSICPTLPILRLLLLLLNRGSEFRLMLASVKLQICAAFIYRAKLRDVIEWADFPYPPHFWTRIISAHRSALK